MIEKFIEAYSYINSRDGFHIGDIKSGIDVYIYTYPEKQVVEIFYTDNSKIDWKTNFKFFFRRWKLPEYADKHSKVRVHGGYLEGWYAIRKQVLDMITADNVLVTGNSQGGGLAPIVAVDIQYNKKPKELYCFDFAGPKVWNKAGRDSFNRRVPNSFKIKNGNDIVTKFPPFYWYSGKKIHIGNKEHWWKFSIKDHADMLNVGYIESELRKVIQ